MENMRLLFGVAGNNVLMSGHLDFLVKEFTILGATLQLWMPIVVVVLLVWAALSLKLETTRQKRSDGQSHQARTGRR